MALLGSGGCGMVDEPGAVMADSGPSLSDTGPGQTLPTPIVNPLPNTVCTETVPLQGAAAAGASVFVFGGMATAGLATDAHPSSGCFCLDVPLKKGVLNTLEVRAKDPLRGMSEPAKVSVTQSTCKTDDIQPEQPEARNVALGLKARASQTAEKGNEGFLTDGKLAPEVEYSKDDWFGNANIWVMVKLEQRTELSKVVVKWRDSYGSGSAYAQRYKVLVTEMSEPGDPNLDNGYWNEEADVTDGGGGVETYSLTSRKVNATHVALWLLKDGTTGLTERFAIAELEVWDVPKVVAPVPTGGANTCASIGACR